MQHDFRFVPKEEWLPVKKELIELITLVQNEVRDYFTFSYTFVGSSCKRRQLITRDLKSNIGYDFDLNFHVNDDDNQYYPDDIKHIIMNAINKYAWKFGYSYCEDSTRVITIKKKNNVFSRIEHSCDICIVYDCSDGRQQYIHFNKKQNSYSWNYLPISSKELELRGDWIKAHGYYNELKEYYLYKKNTNNNPNKKSRSLFSESVNEIYHKYR